jgi:hypothetical protein
MKFITFALVTVLMLSDVAAKRLKTKKPQPAIKAKKGVPAPTSAPIAAPTSAPIGAPTCRAPGTPCTVS